MSRLRAVIPGPNEDGAGEDEAGEYECQKTEGEPYPRTSVIARIKASGKLKATPHETHGKSYNSTGHLHIRSNLHASSLLTKYL